MQIFTGKGDDGSTGLYFGGRVSKTDPIIEATGAADEAQSAIGFARAAIRAAGNDAVDHELMAIERDLWILMAEINVEQSNRDKLEAGKNAVTTEMVHVLEEQIVSLTNSHELPSEFVVPGQNEISARLDLARVTVRRAERAAVSVLPSDSVALAYMNRLSTYLWVLGRVFEGTSVITKEV